MHDVVVLGSANLDVVLGVARLPRPGETVLARSSSTGPGGKGANQAVAAARSGAHTAFVGAVGDDSAGSVLRAELSAAGVDLTALRTSPGPSGTAYVVLDADGENAIVVDPGANGRLTGLDEPQATAVAGARVLLAQLEVPLTTVSTAFAAARGLRVLNAAPACALPGGLTDSLDVLVVNEHEALLVAGETVLEDAVARLLTRVPEVVVTLGGQGALVGRRGSAPVRVPGVPARAVVDTTGAGDTFCGAYAAALAAGADSLRAVRRGCAAGSLSVERLGAARSAPLLADVEARLAEVAAALREALGSVAPDLQHVGLEKSLGATGVSGRSRLDEPSWAWPRR